MLPEDYVNNPGQAFMVPEQGDPNAGSLFATVAEAIASVFPMIGEDDPNRRTTEIPCGYRAEMAEWATDYREDGCECGGCVMGRRVIALYRQAEERMRERASATDETAPALSVSGGMLVSRYDALRVQYAEACDRAEREAQRADHLSRGLDTMLDWHHAMVQRWRVMAEERATYGEWCSVYNDTMVELGITPLETTYETDVTVNISVTIPVRANRVQRREATEDFVRASLSYYSRNELANLIQNYQWTPFDSDFSLDNDREVSVHSVSVEDVEHTVTTSDEI